MIKMKTLKLFIALSLAANVALGGYWFATRSSRENQEQDAPSGATGSTVKKAAKDPADLTSSGSPGAAFATTALLAAVSSWKDLQTEDLKELIRRLRALGCPEDTIQDIIVGEVNRRYAARTRKLWPERYENEPFWKVRKNDPAESKKNREQWRKDRELQKEKSALLVELLGVDPEKQRRKEEGLEENYSWQEQRVAFLPEAKREAVQKFLDDFEDRMQDFYARNRGMWDSETRAEQRQLEAERLKGLGQYLTPDELREFELRSSQLATQLSYDLRNVSLTRDQYESIYDLRKKYGDSVNNYGDVETKEARAQVEQNKEAMDAELAAALGADKFKEYSRGQDYAYQQLARLAKRYDLPADTATKVYDFKEAAERSVKELNADKNLTGEQRQASFQQIRTETEKAVRDALGEQNFKRYQREGGWWINQLGPSQFATRTSTVISR